jgi:cytidylate kinase
MAIIAIARELGARGEELAGELARLAGQKLMDRLDIEEKLGAYGLGPNKLEKFDEKRPGLWASLSQERDDYLHYLKLVIFEEATRPEGCIIVGRGAGIILKGLPNLAAVRVMAPRSQRIVNLKSQFGCDEKRALQLLEHSDHERLGFHKYFFSVDWRDPKEYGLVINTGELGVQDAARLVSEYCKLVSTAEKEKAGAQRAQELLLGQRVVTEIVYGKHVPVHFLEAEARGTRIVLHGVANTQVSIDEAIAAARKVPGVSDVESAIQVVQEFSVMP